jgi:hypothetical protein
VQLLQHRKQAFDVSSDQRVVGGIELRRPNARRKAPQQLVVLRDSNVDV